MRHPERAAPPLDEAAAVLASIGAASFLREVGGAPAEMLLALDRPGDALGLIDALIAEAEAAGERAVLGEWLDELRVAGRIRLGSVGGDGRGGARRSWRCRDVVTGGAVVRFLPFAQSARARLLRAGQPARDGGAMHRRPVPWSAATMVASIATVGAPLVTTTTAGAEPGGIVISELHYHAGSDLDTDDFLELTNTGGERRSTSRAGRSRQGITAVLPAGTGDPGRRALRAVAPTRPASRRSTASRPTRSTPASSATAARRCSSSTRPPPSSTR